MKRFIEEKIAVKCETKEELKDFLQRCEKEGLKWYSGKDAIEVFPEVIPTYISYGFNGKKALEHSSSGKCDHIENKGWKPITYKEYFKQVFKVGDVVKTPFGKGVIKEIHSDSVPYLVYHYGWSGGHNGGNKYAGNHCLFFRKNDIKLVAEPTQETITINRYGNKVVAKYGNKVGVAKCNPEDEFNFETGAKLAFERLFGTEVKEVNRGAKVGEYIKIVDPIMTYGNYKKDDIFKVKSVNIDGYVYVSEHKLVICRREYVVLEGYKPEPQKESIPEKELFKPYLTKEHLNRGLIGEETNLTALFGETLFVGDVVEVFEEWSKNKTERYIVKSTEGFHVDCLEISTINLKNGVCKDKIVHHSTYQVRKIKSYRELQHNEQYRDTRAVLKEDN